MSSPTTSGLDRNLLDSDHPGDWHRLIESLGLPGLLVWTERRMGPALKGEYEPEDVLQEALLHAWRDRARFDWQGIAKFRRWLLRIIDNRIKDLAGHMATQKRGGAFQRQPLEVQGDVPPHVRSITTTPGRLAILKEQAAALRAALEALPEDLEPVVRLRLLEEKSSSEVAEELGLGVSAVKHRLRLGANLLSARVRRTLTRDASGG